MCKNDCNNCNVSTATSKPITNDGRFLVNDTTFKNRSHIEVEVERTDFYEKNGVKISFIVGGKYQHSVDLSSKQRLELIKYLGGFASGGIWVESAASATLDDKEKVISPKQKGSITNDKIKPNHYKLTIPATHKGERILVEVECGDVLKAIEQPFYPSNAMKYLWRAGKKEGESYFDDIRKAKQCLEEELKDRQFE